MTEHLSPVLKALGLETQNGEDACCGLWQACMSSVGVPHVPKIWVTISGAAFTLLLWAGSAEIDLSRLDSLECVWPGWLCLEFVAIGTEPQGPTLFVDISYNCSVVCSYHKLVVP